MKRWALFLVAGLVLGAAHLDGALAPLAWAGVILLSVALEIVPGAGLRACGLFLSSGVSFLVSHHWVYATCLTYLTHDPLVAAGILVGLAALVAAVTQLPAALAVLLLRAVPPRWWWPACWTLGELALQRWFGISFQQLLQSQWSVPPVLRSIHHLGWTPTLIACLFAAACVGEALARRRARRAIPGAVVAALLCLLPPITPRDDALRGVGAVHMADSLPRPLAVPSDIDVLVWPEASISGVRQLDEGPRAGGEVIHGLPETVRAGHLVNVQARSRRGPLNAVVATDARGAIRAVRGKRALVPGGERRFFGIEPGDGGFVPGEASPVLSLGGRRFVTALCWEAYDRSVLAAGRGEGAEIIAVMSNDRALGGSRIAAQQSLGALILRAVELGKPAVRASLWGRAAIVSSDGRVLARSAPGESGVLVWSPREW